MYDSKTDEYEELSGVYSTAEMGWEDWEWVERHWRKAPWTESEAAHERESKKMIESNESIEELEVPISGFLFCVQESIEMVLQDLIGIYNKTRGKKTIQVTDPNSTMEIQSRNWWVELIVVKGSFVYFTFSRSMNSLWSCWQCLHLLYGHLYVQLL